MQDPCDPRPHAAHAPVHHHPPAQVIGRIRRHGTHRIAHRLHAAAGACPAGPPLVVGAATFKATAAAVAFVALTAAASDLTVPEEFRAAESLSAVSPAGYGASGGGGAAHHHRGHKRPIPVNEPPSLTLLLFAALAWAGIHLGRQKS